MSHITRAISQFLGLDALVFSAQKPLLAGNAGRVGIAMPTALPSAPTRWHSSRQNSAGALASQPAVLDQPARIKPARRYNHPQREGFMEDAAMSRERFRL